MAEPALWILSGVAATATELRAVPPPAPPRPTPRLEIPRYDLAAALALERELGISHVLAQVLVRRGLSDPGSARRFLDADLRHPAGAFEGIEDAVGTISRQIARRGRITVHGDYDVDGVCATALLVRALRSLGADVDWFLPSRLEDGYGLSSHTVARLAERGTRLLLTVDCGITAVEQVADARAAGLDVVVCDHHAPRADGQLPGCPIVHPSVGGYPCSELCGTGVAFKLAQALAAPTAEQDLELVALATVADLMPLRDENRSLVRGGLAQLANTARPGLRALMEIARVDPGALSTHGLGFRLAPRINAAGRLRRADAGLELLLTEDTQRAIEIASELDALNAERRAIEERTTWEAEAQVAELGARSAYVLAGEGWHPGVVGIVASRISERYHRPAILVALNGHEPARGSGRSIPGFDLLGALHAAAGELEGYGGHRAAAGLTVARDRVPALAEAFERHAASVLTPELLEPIERVDAIVSGSELGLSLAEELRLLEPCGVGNSTPCLLVPGARFDQRRVLGDGRHVRFSVISGGTRARAVAFGCDGRLPGEPDQPLDATFKLELNEWRGVVEPRLVLRHGRPCAPDPIEVVGEAEDYLAAVLDEIDAPLDEIDAPPDRIAVALPAAGERVVVDRRGSSPLAVLADVVATGEPVLAVCADISRRLEGLSTRIGGFALTSYRGLALASYRGLVLTSNDVLAPSAPALHLVALDPPASAASEALLRAGSGFAHLAWGEAELRFAWQIHELEYGLRASLVALFRALRNRGVVAGEELEHLLRGHGQHGRPPYLAGRLIRILTELELVSLDRDLPALRVVSEQQTALERSPAYRAYARRYEDGRQFLSSARLRPRSA
jgi:single-stranded-DNA-specific exonuclease